MEFTPRMKQILQVMLEENTPVPVKKLADKIGVSKRTVQRELGFMEQSVKGYQVHFLSKTGVGVWLEGEEADKEKLRQALGQEDDYDVSNREDRRKRLTLELLKEKDLKKLFYYSSRFGVSEATISSDLQDVEEWLKKYELYVVRKPGSGISVEGSEENYRRAIRAFISENIDTRIVRDSYEDTDRMTEYYEALKKSNIGQVLNEDIVRRVMDCIMGVDNPRIHSLTENSYVGLVIHISIAVNRILKNEVIEADNRWKVVEDEDYRLARAIVRELEEEFEIQIPPVELSYICLHIKGAKHEKIRWDSPDGGEIENREIQQLVNMMIDVFDSEKAFLLKQDDEFIQGLLAHLQPTLIRIVRGMQIRNPVLEDIKTNYPDIFSRCQNVAKVLEQATGKKVPEEETGFLTVHFGAAMVRLEGRNEQLRKVHVGVVCSSGIGISRLMAAKLENVFRERIQITTYGKNDVTSYVDGKTDFFISSISMEHTESPAIFVNPLLSESDMEEIRRMIYQYERIPEKHKEVNEFTAQLEEINIMAAQINVVIKYMEFFKVDNRISFEELLIAIGEKLSPYSDRREMIREDLMKRERLASQVFAEFGFALLHTRTRGVIRPLFAVCMTKDKGPFEDPYFKGISIVIVMLVPIDENLKVNNQILGYISSMLIEEYEFMDTLLRGNKEEIRTDLSRYLKKYFAKYLSGIN
ncbi:BglG family transcription antiterminator [Fusicatenibacter saccharivorans]|uniref:BglG family transcription antiterminator n=1 Tax=Fusicatenibacter saccharivorans TaxID=1150298 RepID=UPI003D057826